MLDCGMHMGYNDDVSNLTQILNVCHLTLIQSIKVVMLANHDVMNLHVQILHLN